MEDGWLRGDLDRGCWGALTGASPGEAVGTLGPHLGNRRFGDGDVSFRMVLTVSHCLPGLVVIHDS